MAIQDFSLLIDRITDEVLRELSRRSAGGRADIVGEISPAALAPMIDHTILKPDVTRDQVVQLCREALQHGFAAVCVNPVWVKLCADILKGSAVKTCTVIGFPLGASMTDVKAYEARRAIQDGATEVDMVINVGALKGGETSLVESDIRGVVQVAQEYGTLVKVIIETCLLSREEKITACLLSKKAGAQYVKTSTGFSTAGATVEDIRLMKETVGDVLKVKASGGIRTLALAQAMVRAGASRIGTSSGVAMVT
jgi:deoxyribose-phosphate aldolase